MGVRAAGAARPLERALVLLERARQLIEHPDGKPHLAVALRWSGQAEEARRRLPALRADDHEPGPAFAREVLAKPAPTGAGGARRLGSLTVATAMPPAAPASAPRRALPRGGGPARGAPPARRPAAAGLC